jgi:translation initiation factor 2 beta subunit (eIF-2beta)/eIF-5
MIEGEIKVNDKLTLKISAEGQKELFKDLSTVQEIFGENSCGMCGSTDIKYVVRTVDGNDYFELRCNKCGAILSFGQHKKGGTIFPKRKDADGKWLPDRGWHKYVPKK